MCKVLQLPRSNYYYKAVSLNKEEYLNPIISSIFKASRGNYGTRKIKIELQKQGFIVSRKRISRIMKAEHLISKYTKLSFKPAKSSCNDSKVLNILNREFSQKEELAVVVSDLTYVRINKKWCYICVFVDLYNREIIGYSSGPNKDAALVYKSLASVKVDLRKVKLFHTDRGSEFDNKIITEALKAFGIKRSLSNKGCPLDNAVAEATYKIIKTEFIKGAIFEDLDDLKGQLYDYVNWFNYIRTHGTLGYLSPIDYKRNFDFGRQHPE